MHSFSYWVTYSVSLDAGNFSKYISIDLLWPVMGTDLCSLCLFAYLLICFITLDLYSLSDGLPWTILLLVCGEI